MTTLITSLNKQLWNEYGKAMLDGYQKFSRDVKLVIVFEGQLPDNLILKTHLVSLIRLQSREFNYFKSTIGKLYEARGIRLTQSMEDPLQYNLEYDYRFNLVKFSFKIFSLMIASDHISKNERFAWIDADLKCLNEFCSSQLDDFFPDDDQIMSYLGRTYMPPPHKPYSECGFLGFNPKHEQTTKYLERMLSLYMTGEAFRFEQWHDSWLWDQVRREFEIKGFKFKNISGRFQNTEHPFINCGLGKFFDHLKGAERKVLGHSLPTDYI